MAPPFPPDDWIACHDCDLVHRLPTVDGAHTARCRRCGAVLYQRRVAGIDPSLALSLTGLILFVLANTFPLIGFEMAGRSQQTVLASGAVALWQAGFWGLSSLVFVTSIVFPLAALASLVYVLLPLRLGFLPWRVHGMLRFARALKPWAMVEVYMLGVFVAVAKLIDFAAVTPGVALYCFLALVFVVAAAEWMLDGHDVWRRIEALQ